MAANNNLITTGGTIQKQPNQTIILTAPKRGGLDLSYYMNAIRAAENIDWPRRVKLLDLYEDTGMDTHVVSVMTKLKGEIFSTPINFMRGGAVDDKIQEYIESPWFLDFLIDVFEDEWKGVGGSLFQFYREDGWIKYMLSPRKHTDAINRTILRNQTDLTGQSWDNFSDLLYVGKPRQIGRMAELAFWVILKRNDVGDWANFAEVFGQPMREGTYDPFDDNARQKLIQDILALGSSPVFIHPNDTNIKLLESQQKSGSGDLYEKLAKFCNAEISKGVLSNTLTTEAGDKGTQALGTVHQAGEENVAFFIKRRLLNVLNYEVTDIWANLGLDTRGGKFVFNPPKNKDLAKKIVIDCKLKNEVGLPIDDDYFYEEYGIPKPDNYAELKKDMEARKGFLLPPVPDNDPKPAGSNPPAADARGQDEQPPMKSPKNLLARFFVAAPGKGALKW